MSNLDDILNSIEEYKNQLAQVDNALKLCTADEDKTSLINLQRDLKELLELTQETLDEQQASASTVDGDDPFADEMRLFMDEVKADENTECVDVPFEKKIQAIKTELDAMIGKKCLAPYIHSWGSKAHHNAFVCGLDDTNEYNEDDLDQVKVRVLFTNPTHREMIPCSYYLDGDCRFDANKCRFSHGELVLFNELKEYKEPDFSLLSKVNACVLAKQNDRIWYKGRIISSNFQLKTCTIKLEQSSKEISCAFEDTLPTGSREGSNAESSDSDSSTDDDDDDPFREMHRAHLIEKSLLTPVADQPLGEWEKYTKGFGSKMMAKYGYIIGNGLGSNGEGIIVPISAQILPPGRSLDHCMELREQSNGDKDLFSVERKLKKAQQKQEANNIKAYEREKQSGDIFSFINENVFAINSSHDTTNTKEDPKQRLENHSTKKLNVTGLKLSEDIRRKEREILKLKESMARQKIGSTIYSKLHEQLNARNGELEALKRSENNVAKEQVFRKNKSKLSVF